MKKNYYFYIVILLLFFFPFKSFSNNITYLNSYELKGEKNFISGYDSKNINGSYNAVIEIPAGSNEKWEVSKDGELIKLEFKNGKPRIINYIGYPVNYGFIPKTLLPTSEGGDGDQLDILVFSQSPLQRGQVVEVKIIGMLKMKDKGLLDNKILAILDDNSGFYRINSLNQLDNQYPGILEIIRIWFSNYKETIPLIDGYEKKVKTIKLIEKSIKFYYE
tara:strand:- start:72 stop:728 length:657 start_codon:yes stop_codon:yes gene_type:complete